MIPAHPMAGFFHSINMPFRSLSEPAHGRTDSRKNSRHRAVNQQLSGRLVSDILRTDAKPTPGPRTIR
jgi:hypothetical protein